MADDDATTIAPEVTLTQAAPTLAWSDADSDDLHLPGSWRPVFRNALAVFSTCVAVAGAVTAVDRHWFSDLRTAVVAAVPVAVAPPMPDVPDAIADPVTAAPAAVYPMGPAAEHLVPPAPPGPAVDPNADAKYLTRMQQAGIMITDVPAAITTGHIICADMTHGLSSEGEARLVMRDNPGMAHMYAIGWVYAAIDTYCPEHIGR